MLGAKCFAICCVACEWQDCIETMQELPGLAEFGGQEGNVFLGQIEPFAHVFGKVGQKFRRQQFWNGFITSMQRYDVRYVETQIPTKNAKIDADVMRVDQLNAVLGDKSGKVVADIVPINDWNVIAKSLANLVVACVFRALDDQISDVKPQLLEFIRQLEGKNLAAANCYAVGRNDVANPGAIDCLRFAQKCLRKDAGDRSGQVLSQSVGMGFNDRLANSIFPREILYDHLRLFGHMAISEKRAARGAGLVDAEE